MKKAKIVIADNEDGKGWFIYRVDYVTEVDVGGNSEFVDNADVEVGNGVTITK